MIIPSDVDLATVTRDELVAALERDGYPHDDAVAAAGVILSGDTTI